MKSDHLWGGARLLFAVSAALLCLGFLPNPGLFGFSDYRTGSSNDSQPVAVTAIIGIISAITGLVTAVASLITALVALRTIRSHAGGGTPNNTGGAPSTNSVVSYP
ncbi:hypothetical protein ACF1GY_09685 [Streptomyces sp. NPDC014684]|uniref:hypothetical protein n=1 Tax=Streptomyces sp. NPDC014684 TaxID=3364880 RepID=UPI0036FB7DEB